MTVPDFVFDMKKVTLADDPASPIAGRSFEIPLFTSDGEYTSNVRVHAKIWDGANGTGNEVDGSFNVQLRLLSGEIWVTSGPMLVNVSEGATFTLPFGSANLPNYPAQAYFQITSVASATGASMTFHCELEQTQITPRGPDGAPLTVAGLNPADTTVLALLASLAAIQTNTAPPTAFKAVVPSDTTDLSAIATKGLYVTVSGNLTFEGISDVAPTTIPVTAGQFVPGHFLHVMAATTATVIASGG